MVSMDHNYTSEHFNYENDDDNIYLQSLGAAGTVTGSKHLLRTPGYNILIDCGLFQGLKSLREKNWQALSIHPSQIDAVILTHAHLDHCGYLPLLAKEGYKGRIYMTHPTAELTELILKDSAKIQEEDAERANRHQYTRHHPARPLYTVKDVEACLPQFKLVAAEKEQQLSDHISFRFVPAGHILGACSLKFSCYGKTIVFSGDIGRKISELLPPPQAVQGADFVVMESTYGDRLHPEGDMLQFMANAINEAAARQGNILIPCFAVGRAQELIHAILRMKEKGYIASSLPVFLDSPMAAAADKILHHYPDWIKISKKECSQMFSDVTINHDYSGTKKIIEQRGSKIILSASGMLTGGRVLEYLKNYVTDPRNLILIMGFQAEGTRGRALLNGSHEVKVHGNFYPVKAEVKEVQGFSAHADQTELMEWLFQTGNPGHVYLVHGEPCALEALRVKVKDQMNCRVTVMEPEKRKFLFSINHPYPGGDPTIVAK